MCQSQQPAHVIVKLADDSFNQDHGPVVSDYIRCSYFLDINVNKTKEMVVDFREKNRIPFPLWLLMIWQWKLCKIINTLELLLMIE